jgi:hypothetical protein
MSKPYTYHPLLETRSIRVLKLLPSSDTSNSIKITLSEVSLDNSNLRYEALSYVWGARSGTLPITCTPSDGQPNKGDTTILVTPNCLAALQILRRHTRKRTLWIDAICINQSSIPEKSAQVALMGEIYAKAARTLVCLDPNLEQLGKLEITMISACFWISDKLKLMRGQSGAPYALFAKLRPETMRKLCNTLSNERGKEAERWENRVWTLQELLLSRKAVIMLGKRCVSWGLLRSIALGIDPDDAFTGKFLLNGDTGALEGRIRALRAFEEARTKVHASKRKDDDDQYHGLVSPDDPTLQDYISGLYNSILLQVGQFATEPKDRIYGLIGILTSLGLEAPSPDYSLGTEDAYSDMMRLILDETSSLVMLKYAGKLINPGDMPSWVPSWGVHSPPENHGIRSLAENEDLTTTLRSSYQSKPLLHRRRLTITGKLFGTVEKCGPLSEHFYIQRYEEVEIPQDGYAPFVQFVCDTAKQVYPNQKVPRGSKLSYAIHELWFETRHSSADDYDEIRVWMQSGMPQNSKSQEKLAALLDGGIERENWMDGTGEDFEIDDDLRLLDLLRPPTVRVFAVADTVGLSLNGILQDDIIVLAEGACYPLILRPHGEHYQFIWFCVVWGIMEGQAWPKNCDRCEFQEFVLV